MKIAQVVPIWYPVPPRQYGGLERVVDNIINEQVRRGHDVTLFGVGESKTKAKINSVLDKAPDTVDWHNYKEKELENLINAVEKSGQFDIVHFHASTSSIPVMLTQFCHAPSVITTHNYMDFKGDFSIVKKYHNCNYISLSDAQRKPFPSELNFVGTVYNGINPKDYHLSLETKDEVAFLGRFCFDKGAAPAVAIAEKAGVKITMMGNIPDVPEEQQYFHQKVEPYFGKSVEYLGEGDEKKKDKYLGQAKALLFPIQWEEPFGLVMVEAMACGTPVIAYDRGSVGEVVKDGVTGFVCPPNDEAAMVKAIKTIMEMPEDQYLTMRKNCRQHVEDQFTIARMIDGYDGVYKKVIEKYHRTDKSSSKSFLQRIFS